MRLLVCAATAGELAAWDLATPGISTVVSGVGIPATFVGLGSSAAVPPDRILNIGIAGAYPGSGLRIGDVVVGTSECYGDIGFSLPEPPYFRPITESPFGTFYASPLPLWVPQGLGAALGRGCTVSTCTGTAQQGRQRETLFQAHFETMEGAAVAQVGAQWGVPVCEVRAISNIASTRDMRGANIQRSLQNLRAFLQEWGYLFSLEP